MRHHIIFPIKGTYYHEADKAFQMGLLHVDDLLEFKIEAENPHDPNAIQIWVKHSQDLSYLLGYVPRQLALYWQPLLKRQNPEYRLSLHKSVARGKLFRLECQLSLKLNWLQRLHFKWLAFWIRQQHRFKHSQPPTHSHSR